MTPGARAARALLAPVAALILHAEVARAQSASPPARAHHALIYDAVGKRVLLTGGSTPVDGGASFRFFNDLWSYDGVGWVELRSSGAKLSGVQLAADAGNRIWSFGGFDGTAKGELRTLVGEQWQEAGVHPVLRVAEPGFIFDGNRRRFIAFGGSAGQREFVGDVWEYDGAAWTRSTLAAPPARAAHVMIYDERRGRTVVFGGMAAGAAGGPPTPLGDTWEFDGATWSQVAATGPAPRFGAGAAYDSKRGRIIVYGGLGEKGFLGDTWSWDGRTWTRLSDTGPEARGMGYLAYDRDRDRVVLFGGRKGYPDGDLGDTWEWDGVRWIRMGR